MKRLGKVWMGCVAAFYAMATAVWAAGEPASELVVVADTRVIDNKLWRYFADLYNTDVVVFAIWATVLTAVYGVFLGLLMDQIMARTGLDLKSRKIVEH